MTCYGKMLRVDKGGGWVFEGWVGWVSRAWVGKGHESGLKLSFNHLWSYHRLTDCKLDSVVHAGVCGCRYGELIWTCLAWAKQSYTRVVRCQATDSIPPQVSRKEWLWPSYWLIAGQSVAYALMQSAKLRYANLPVFTSLVEHDEGMNLSLPHPERMSYATWAVPV